MMFLALVHHGVSRTYVKIHIVMQPSSSWHGDRRSPILDFVHGYRFVLYPFRPAMRQDTQPEDGRHIGDGSNEMQFC